jgi:FSR family fosmidomycin resistance protein-like MFS transporter
MSLFSIGGNLGYSLGVIVTTPIVVAFGVKGGALVVLPTVAVAVVLLAASRYLLTFVPRAKGPGARTAGEDRLGALGLLLGIVTVRSVAWFGLVTFVSWRCPWGTRRSTGTPFCRSRSAGAVDPGGGACCRPLRARCLVRHRHRPARRVILVGGAPSGRAALTGAMIVCTFSVTMVMSEYMPRRACVGLTSPDRPRRHAVTLGALADWMDLEAALWVCAVAPLLGIVLTLLLPATRVRAHLEPEVVVP